MVYLVGVNHGVQFIKDAYTREQIDIVNKFGDFIRQNIGKFCIKMLAEEMDIEALARQRAKSCMKNIAVKKSIEHLFCNPTKKEKLELNINTDADREKEWLRRIKEYTQRNILFICGHSHLCSFKNLLQANRIECQIISEEYWGKELDANEQIARWIEKSNPSLNTGSLVR